MFPSPIIKLHVPTYSLFLLEGVAVLNVRLEVRFVQTQFLVPKPQMNLLFPGFHQRMLRHNTSGPAHFFWQNLR